MFKKVKLKNGLTIILDQNKKKHITSAVLYVRAGGLDTSFKADGKECCVNNGTAHLLEHYLIEQSIYGNISKIFSRDFIKSNGATSLNDTSYFFSTVHHFKNTFIKLLNIVNNPDFSEKKLELVKKPIIQEIRMDADSPGKSLGDAIMNNTLETKIANVNSGSEEEVAQITIEDLKFYHEIFYRPENQIITLTGNFPDNILDIIEDEYNKFNFKNNDVQKRKIDEPKSVVNEFQIINDKTIPEKLFQINYKVDLSSFTPLEKDKIDYYFNYLYYNNFSELSEFYNSLVKDKLVVYSILHYFQPNLIKNTLIFSIKVYTDYYDKVIDMVKDKMSNLESDLKSFSRWKNNMIIAKINDLENSNYRVNNYIDNYLLYDFEEFDTLEFVQNLNLDEYLELFKRIDFSNCSIIVNDNDK